MDYKKIINTLEDKLCLAKRMRLEDGKSYRSDIKDLRADLKAKTEENTALKKAIDTLKETLESVDGLKDYAVESNRVNFERAETAEARVKFLESMIQDNNYLSQANEFHTQKIQAEATAQRYREATTDFLKDMPQLCCEDFHHRKKDQHPVDPHCPVENRHYAALAKMREALKEDKEKP